jgi:hypothetical protein
MIQTESSKAKSTAMSVLHLDISIDAVDSLKEFILAPPPAKNWVELSIATEGVKVETIVLAEARYLAPSEWKNLAQYICEDEARFSEYHFLHILVELNYVWSILFVLELFTVLNNFDWNCV